MRPEAILEILRAQPFEPFRMYLTDGAVYEIRHRDMAIVQRSKVIVAVPGRQGPDGPAERTVGCALIDTARTEMLNGASASGGDQDVQKSVTVPILFGTGIANVVMVVQRGERCLIRRFGNGHAGMRRRDRRSINARLVWRRTAGQD